MAKVDDVGGEKPICIGLRDFIHRPWQSNGRSNYVFLQLSDDTDMSKLSSRVGCSLRSAGCYRAKGQWFIRFPFNDNLLAQRYGLTQEGQILIQIIRRGFIVCIPDPWHSSDWLASTFSEYYSAWLIEETPDDSWWPRSLYIWTNRKGGCGAMGGGGGRSATGGRERE